jgi:hypothetical protein
VEMPSHSDSAIKIQRRYYTETAEHYDHMHTHEGAGDPSNLKYVAAWAVSDPDSDPLRLASFAHAIGLPESGKS